MFTLNSSRTHATNSLRIVNSDVQRLPFALQTAMLFGVVLCFAEPTAQAGASGSAPKTAAQASLKQPILDVSKMDEDEVRLRLQELLTKQAAQGDRVAQRTIRFNDGSETIYYEAGEQMREGGKAKGGEVKSARDSGTLSIYGFGRNPISLYANQWLDLFQFGGEVVDHIAANADHIDEFVRTKRGNESGKRDVNMAAVERLQEVFAKLQGSEPIGETDDTGAAGDDNGGAVDAANA